MNRSSEKFMTRKDRQREQAKGYAKPTGRRRIVLSLDQFRDTGQIRRPSHNFSVDPRILPTWLVDFLARIDIERPAPKPFREVSAPYERPD